MDVLRNVVGISLDRTNVRRFDCTHAFPRGTLSYHVCSSDSWLWLLQNCVLRDTGTPLRLPKSPHSDIIDDSQRPFGNHVDITAPLVPSS